MTKGAHTRTAILERAASLASEVGLSGLTIGELASDLDLSKSGLFAHFGSKEALQVAVLDYAAESFTDHVIRPSLAQPRGEARVRAIFDLWVRWGRDRVLKGGCIFVAASSELDDRHGPVRDRLVVLQREWLAALAVAVEKCVATGEFDARTDAAQFAQDLYGIMLSYHHQHRLMQDPDAELRARRAFARLLADARVPALVHA